MRPHRRFVAFTALCAVLSAPSRAADLSAADAVAEADRLWAARAEGATSGEVPPARIDPVIALCRKAIELDPESLEGRWRLMRAFYFKGEYTTRVPEEQKRIFEEGKKAGEEALAVIRRKVSAATGRPADKEGPVALAPAAKAIPGAAATFLWTGIDWGKWALVFGKTAAARQGAAAKIRDDAEAAILIDPDFEEGAGYRLLGRVHHQTPSIPFITGWASRSQAIRNLGIAIEKGPKNFYNRLYWAEVLHDYEPSRREEAKKALESLVADTPSPAFLVEDLRVQEEAREDLKAWAR